MAFLGLRPVFLSLKASAGTRMLLSIPSVLCCIHKQMKSLPELLGSLSQQLKDSIRTLMFACACHEKAQIFLVILWALF